METRRTLLVDAFTDEPLAGNVAGVVPDATGLSDDRMGRIAAELGASETAFVTPAASDGDDPAGDEDTTDDDPAGDDDTTDDDTTDDDPDHRIRYFTPTTEVDLCGHATVAAYATLFADGTIDAGEYTLRTNVGDLTIRVDDDGGVRMRQEPPGVTVVGPDTLDADRLGDALGIDPAALRDVGADLPVAVASTGLPFLVVPVNFLEHLGGASPDPDAIEAISDEFDVAGVYAFTFDTLDGESTLHGRAFAPAVGIDEDPVTGTASGAVGGYLRAVEAFDGDTPDELRFEQGHFVDRPGYVRVWVGDAGDPVTIGGDAVVSLDGDLRLPDEAGDDDILVV